MINFDSRKPIALLALCAMLPFSAAAQQIDPNFPQLTPRQNAPTTQELDALTTDIRPDDTQLRIAVKSEIIERKVFSILFSGFSKISYYPDGHWKVQFNSDARLRQYFSINNIPMISTLMETCNPITGEKYINAHTADFLNIIKSLDSNSSEKKGYITFTHMKAENTDVTGEKQIIQKNCITNISVSDR